MKIPLIDLKAQHKKIINELNEAITKVIESGKYILGENVELLENEISSLIGAKYAVGVANGTDALKLALKSYGIKSGDKVITTPFTFFATAESISQVGAIPVFVDIDESTYNIDVRKIEESITEDTKAILPVHLFGQPADMNPIIELAKKYGLFLIEDACQAIGAKYKGKRVGSLGDAGCFSFFPTKNLGGIGDGGMIVTNDEAIYENIRMLRFHGQRVKYYNEMLGYNSRIDEIQAAILRVKLKYLNEWNERRRYLAYRYNELLENTPLKTPKELDNIYSVYNLYVVQSDERDRLAEFLNNNGIATGIYYPVPLHLQKAYENLNYRERDFPVAESISKKVLALPLYPEMTDEIHDYIVCKIMEFYLNG